jgi:hypothetical protein
MMGQGVADQSSSAIYREGETQAVLNDRMLDVSNPFSVKHPQQSPQTMIQGQQHPDQTSASLAYTMNPGNQN